MGRFWNNFVFISKSITKYKMYRISLNPRARFWEGSIFGLIYNQYFTFCEWCKTNINPFVKRFYISALIDSRLSILFSLFFHLNHRAATLVTGFHRTNHNFSAYLNARVGEKLWAFISRHGTNIFLRKTIHNIQSASYDFSLNSETITHTMRIHTQTHIHKH